MPKRQRGGFPGSPRSDSSASSSGSSRHSTASRQGGNGASSSSSDETVQRLCSIFLDMRVEVARYLLEACNWDLEKAVQLHLESPSEIPGITSGNGEIPEHANRFDSLVIHDDDSDDDSHIPYVRQRMNEAPNRPVPPPKPIARSLDADEVRAPIAPQQMRLVDDMPAHGSFRPLNFQRAFGGASSSGGPSANYRAMIAGSYPGNDAPGSSGPSTFDRYRYLASDTLPIERVAQSNAQSEASSSSSESRSRSHQAAPIALPNSVPSNLNEDGSTTTLDRIFKPPVELLFRGSFQEARRHATAVNRWLLVNIQELNEFPSLCMNRDIWREKRFVDLIQSKFILWQVYHDGHEGARFNQFYKVNKFPYVGLIDPRTGERVLALPTNPNELMQKLIEFLADRPKPETTPSTSPQKKQKVGSNENIAQPAMLNPAAASKPPTVANGNNKTSTSSAFPITEKQIDVAPMVNGNSKKIEPSATPKQIDVNVGPAGSSPFYHVLVHLPTDDRLLIKLYEAATLDELITAISTNFETITSAEFMLIRNAATPGGAKTDLLALSVPAHSVFLRDTLKFCKREKLFLDLKQ